MVWEHVVARENDSKTLLNIMIKKGQIDINAWGFIAADRPRWRRSLHQAKKSTSRGEETAEEKGEGDVSTSSRLPSIWHLLLTLQQDLQIKNVAIESPQDTWPTIRRRHPRFER